MNTVTLRRIASFALAILMLAAVVGCGGDGSKSGGKAALDGEVKLCLLYTSRCV